MNTFVTGVVMACIMSLQGSVGLTLRTLIPSAKAGQVVKVQVTVTNSSDTVFTYNNMNRDCDYSFTVLAPSGSRASETDYKKQLKCGPNGLMITGRNIIVSLKPGESNSEEVRLTDLYNLSEPGQYSITVSRDFPHLGRLRSNTVTLSVSK